MRTHTRCTRQTRCTRCTRHQVHKRRARYILPPSCPLAPYWTENRIRRAEIAGGGASEKRRTLARASASRVSLGSCSVLSSTACLTSAFWLPPGLLGFWTLSAELVARKGDAGEGGDRMLIALHVIEIVKMEMVKYLVREFPEKNIWNK